MALSLSQILFTHCCMILHNNFEEEYFKNSERKMNLTTYI